MLENIVLKTDKNHSWPGINSFAGSMSAPSRTSPCCMSIIRLVTSPISVIQYTPVLPMELQILVHVICSNPKPILSVECIVRKLSAEQLQG